MNAKILIAAVALVSSNAVFAATNPGDVYAGASYSTMTAKESPFSLDFGVLNGFAGYQINDYLAVEGRVGVGIADESLDVFESSAVDVGVDYTAQALVKGSYHFSDVVSAYGIAGVAKNKYSFSQGNQSNSSSDTGLTYGVGVQFAISGNSALNLEYQKLPDMDMDDDAGISVSALTVGYTYRF